jgi:hypothetical protein
VGFSAVDKKVNGLMFLLTSAIMQFVKQATVSSLFTCMCFSFLFFNFRACVCVHKHLYILITKINDRNVRTMQARYVLNSISWKKIITRNRKRKT